MTSTEVWADKLLARLERLVRHRPQRGQRQTPTSGRTHLSCDELLENSASPYLLLMPRNAAARCATSAGLARPLASLHCRSLPDEQRDMGNGRKEALGTPARAPWMK